MAEQAAPASYADEDPGVFFVALHYKGTAYHVPVQAEDGVASIFDFVQEALDFPRENCKLIHRGKMLLPDRDAITVGDAGIKASAKLMLVASSAHDVSFVQSSRPDPLVKGFAEEERDERNRRKRARAAGASAWGTQQDSEFRFNSIKAEFKFTDPPPYEAERLLQKLSTDPGIIELMKTRHFKVGILTEMSPVEAQERMAKRGTPNMDLLGYNQNAGEMIVLRLRTDSLKGFRPYHDLINTLIHELTHNVWGDHDQKFWKLFGELKAQYMKFHRFWSHGGRAADSNAGGQFEGFNGSEDADREGGTGFGVVLGGGGGGSESSGSGGGAPLSEAQRRARAALAAEARLVEEKAGVPNFLNSNGAWVIACPCGQIHDGPPCMEWPAVSEDGSKAAIEGSVGAPVVEEAPQPAAPSTSQASSSDAVASPSTEPAAVTGVDSSAVAGLVPLLDASDRAPGASDVAAAAMETSDVAPDSPMEAGDAAPDSAMGAVDAAPQSPLGPMDVAPDSPVGPMDVTPDGTFGELPSIVDIGDLEAVGLDGAAVWIQRFSQQLRALGGAGRPAARSAVELLLRLVRNIVESPQEAKFRRVRAENPKVKSCLLGAGAGEVEALMSMLGFQPAAEAGQRVFLLEDRTFDSARLRLGQELLERELHCGPVTA